MSQKLNVSFLNAYIELDKLCAREFGVSHSGVTEYINRLINMKFATGRDEVLPKLVKYRNIRNKMAHEEGALMRMGEVDKSDIKWLAKFNKDVRQKKDPISMYLKKARRYAAGRKIKAGLIVTLIILAIALVVFLLLRKFS